MRIERHCVRVCFTCDYKAASSNGGVGGGVYSGGIESEQSKK